MITHRIKQFLLFLEKRRRFNIAIVIAYFVFIIAMHGPIVRLSVRIMNWISFTKYNLAVASIVVVLLVWMCYSFYRKMMARKEERLVPLVFFLLTVFLIILHSRIMFVMNIEIIHSFQYAVCALLLFPIWGRFGYAVFFSTLFGAADEWYQYLILRIDKPDYFDFNDITMDLFGAGIAMVWMLNAGMAPKPNSKNFRWWKSPVALSAGFIIVSVLVMFHFSLLQVYGGDYEKKPLMVFNQAIAPESFWRSLPNSDITYHVMQPMEGTIVLSVLLGLYFMMDYLSFPNPLRKHT